MANRCATVHNFIKIINMEIKDEDLEKRFMYVGTYLSAAREAKDKEIALSFMRLCKIAVNQTLITLGEITE